jgi:hypothetical protein
VPNNPYRGYQFPKEIISKCVWLHFNFAWSLRDVDLMIAFRGVPLSYESIRLWCEQFGRSSKDCRWFQGNPDFGRASQHAVCRNPDKAFKLRRVLLPAAGSRQPIAQQPGRGIAKRSDVVDVDDRILAGRKRQSFVAGHGVCARIQSAGKIVDATIARARRCAIKFPDRPEVPAGFAGRRAIARGYLQTLRLVSRRPTSCRSGSFLR